MIPDKLAVIIVVPSATDVANPIEPAELLIAATPGLDECQATVAVRSCVEASVNVPAAVNCWVFPSTMLVLVGAMTIDTNVA